MAEKENLEKPLEQPRIPTPQAATQRILVEMGMKVEAFGQAVRHLKQRPPHVYNIQLRSPVRTSHDVLMLVKAVGESGPVIAFHTGATMAEAVLTWASRLNAGRIKWREDDYPPSNYEEIAGFIEAEVEFFSARFGDSL